MQTNLIIQIEQLTVESRWVDKQYKKKYLGKSNRLVDILINIRPLRTKLIFNVPFRNLKPTSTETRLKSHYS